MAVNDHTDSALANFFGMPASENASAKEKVHEAGKMVALSMARSKAAKAEEQREEDEDHQAAEAAGMPLRAWGALRDRPALTDEQARAQQASAEKKRAAGTTSARSSKAPRTECAGRCEVALTRGNRKGQPCDRKLPCRLHTTDSALVPGQATLSELVDGEAVDGEAEDGEVKD